MVESKPPSILVVGVIWPPQTFLARLFRGLLEAGFSVTIASAKKPDESWQNYNQLHWLHTPEKYSIRSGFSLARSMIKMTLPGTQKIDLSQTELVPQKAELNKLQLWKYFYPFVGGQWDVIYFPWNSTAVHYLPLFDLEIPVVISCRGSQVNVAPHVPRRAFLLDGLRESFARATAVHCVSDDIKNEAAKYGLDPAKACVIRPAVDPEFFHPLVQKKRNEKFRIVSVGSLVWIKGYEDALTAVHELVQQGVPVQYDIIGTGAEKQRILFTIDDLNLQNHVQLLGKLPPAEVRNQLQQADAFLLSSHSEGISNAVLEAMACGLPVVTTDCGGMTEAVSDGVEGFVIPTAEPIVAAKQLKQLADSPQLRRQMGQAGRDRIKSEFTLADQITQFTDLFTSISSHVETTA